MSTLRTVATSTPSRSANGWRFGAIATTAPTLRSRFGQPSRRLPMPFAKESSTVEWHSAHVMPTLVILSPSNTPFTPTTALARSSSSVVSGLSRLTAPSCSTSTRMRRDLAHVDLQSGLQRLSRRETCSDAALLLAEDRLVQAQALAPEILAAERVVAEGLATFLQHAPRVFLDAAVEVRALLLGLHRRIGGHVLGDRGAGKDCEGEESRERDSDRVLPFHRAPMQQVRFLYRQCI